jgi:hypothetical protein
MVEYGSVRLGNFLKPKSFPYNDIDDADESYDNYNFNEDIDEDDDMMTLMRTKAMRIINVIRTLIEKN